VKSKKVFPGHHLWQSEIAAETGNTYVSTATNLQLMSMAISKKCRQVSNSDRQQEITIWSLKPEISISRLSLICNFSDWIPVHSYIVWKFCWCRWCVRLKIAHLGVDDSGTYRCEGYNQFGHQWTNGTLLVRHGTVVCTSFLVDWLTILSDGLIRLMTVALFGRLQEFVLFNYQQF